MKKQKRDLIAEWRSVESSWLNESAGTYSSDRCAQQCAEEFGSALDALETERERANHFEALAKSASADLHTTVHEAEKLKERVAELEALVLDEHSRLSREMDSIGDRPPLPRKIVKVHPTGRCGDPDCGALGDPQ